ncbi:serine/threonine protein kinase [Ciceribacter sp. L1K23]|uniref:serine/threonine-protein kinase n=1 Tax=Ciceribacter sp. L1K23 TaxID=2820276 RepID=UPI001B81C6B6|nr:serine/threonine-protein kinase [Ciceribacter sp. L1K23]MBR0558401.1 serine/threonine protein kinase [Ciceribacter sp. L1K23]
MSYEILVSRLKAVAADNAPAVVRAVSDVAETGRLPADIAAILLGQLPLLADDKMTPPPGDNQGQSREMHLFEEATIPHAFVPAWPSADGRITATAVNQTFATEVPSRAPTPAVGVLPPVQPMHAAEALPGFDELRTRVDDVVLSGLIGDYKALRGSSNPPADDANGRRPDQLNNLLGTYRSARFRSTARRVVREGAGDGTPLNKLADYSSHRAGVGSILRDRFILDTEIGRGGMGVVYCAVDRRRLEAGSQQPYVALKLLNDAFRANSNALRTLEAEARKAQSLAHPNIATVFDFDRDKTEVFIVMELLTGQPLNRLLSERTGQAMEASLVAAVLRGICGGLAHAHANGVVHSDLKPGNIFVGDDRLVKLLDFGLATAGNGAGFDAVQLGALTAAYASPEMFEGAERDPRDDIFALGCIAYQMLVGFHPFSMQASNEARDRGLAPEQIPDLDPMAWDALRKALSFDRSERPESVDAFAAALFET